MSAKRKTSQGMEPVHPGHMLRDDVLPAAGLSIAEAAQKLRISRQHLHRITREEDPAPITPDMAVRLGKLFGNGPRLWLNMQAAYDLWHAERSVDVSKIPTVRAAE